LFGEGTPVIGKPFQDKRTEEMIEHNLINSLRVVYQRECDEITDRYMDTLRATTISGRAEEVGGQTHIKIHAGMHISWEEEDWITWPDIQTIGHALEEIKDFGYTWIESDYPHGFKRVNHGHPEGPYGVHNKRILEIEVTYDASATNEGVRWVDTPEEYEAFCDFVTTDVDANHDAIKLYLTNFFKRERAIVGGELMILGRAVENSEITFEMWEGETEEGNELDEYESITFIAEPEVDYEKNKLAPTIVYKILTDNSLQFLTLVNDLMTAGRPEWEEKGYVPEMCLDCDLLKTFDEQNGTATLEIRYSVFDGDPEPTVRNLKTLITSWDDQDRLNEVATSALLQLSANALKEAKSAELYGDSVDLNFIGETDKALSQLGEVIHGPRKKALPMSEITRYEKETGKKSFGKHDITKYVTNTVPVKYAFTMVDIEKVGLNPRTKFNTPAGVYFYPLNQEYYEKLVKNKLPYASEKPYVGVVRLKDTNTDKWLKFISGGRDFQTTENVLEAAKRVGIYDQRVTPSDLPSGIDAYWELPGDEQMGLRHWDFNNDAKIFDLTWYGTKGFRRSTLKWNKLLRDLGYIGIYDNNNSIIHPGEPFQMVALSPEAYEVVGFYTTADIRKVDFPTSTRKLQQMASKRGLPKWVYQKLAASNDWVTLKTLITNPDMSKEVFEFIYNNNPSKPIILELAKSIFTPVEILRKIARESFPGNFHGGGISMIGLAILEHVAENPNASEDVLMSLAGLVDGQIRAAVASNDNTGVKVLKKIVEVGGLEAPDLVRAIIYNPNINSEIFHQLVSHQDITSRGLSLLANSPLIPAELLTKMAMKYRGQPGRLNPNLSVTGQINLRLVLAEIARNPRTPESTLRMLYKSETYLAVQRAIASNPSTPVDILE
jgi:hypothetical protein